MTLIGLALLAAWELSGGDLPLSRLYATTAGFPWREHWLTSRLLHDGARLVGWAFFGLLLLSVWRPRLLVSEMPRRERLWWICTTLTCVAVIPLLKRSSATSCPWSLMEFGGGVAQYVPHWLIGVGDGGPGGCFPSGHASTAFSLLPGWFALRGHAPKAAKRLLAVVVGAGVALAWVQLMRGAHYLSHSLWTAWICWSISVLAFHGTRFWRCLRSPAQPQAGLDAALKIRAPLPGSRRSWNTGISGEARVALDQPQGGIDGRGRDDGHRPDGGHRHAAALAGCEPAGDAGRQVDAA